MIEFRCLVPDYYRPKIDAVAAEFDARVDYFRGTMWIMSIHVDGDYRGYVWLQDKSTDDLREAVLGVLNAY